MTNKFHVLLHAAPNHSALSCTSFTVHAGERREEESALFDSQARSSISTHQPEPKSHPCSISPLWRGTSRSPAVSQLKSPTSPSSLHPSSIPPATHVQKLQSNDAKKPTAILNIPQSQQAQGHCRDLLHFYTTAVFAN